MPFNNNLSKPWIPVFTNLFSFSYSTCFKVLITRCTFSLCFIICLCGLILTLFIFFILFHTFEKIPICYFFNLTTSSTKTSTSLNNSVFISLLEIVRISIASLSRILLAILWIKEVSFFGL